MPIQNDIGFEPGLNKWFISNFTATRQPRGNYFIKGDNLQLVNVTVDTYSFHDQNNKEISHGRLRFYEGSDVSIHGNGNDMDSVKITGNSPIIEFVLVKSTNTRIKYNIPDMTWTIEADGKNYVAKDIRGKATGKFLVSPIRFEFAGPVEFLYSPLIALFGTNLILK